MDKNYNLNGSYQPTPKRFADLKGPDFYPTPEWATIALIDNERFYGDIWECACGNGAMSNILTLTGNTVFSSDLYDRGYGKSGIDFLKSNRKASNIITNPPFNSAESFVQQGIQLAEKKFALLLRLAFLEGGRRHRNIFSINPPSRVWVFSERVTFYPEGALKKGGGATAYAWFVWDQVSKGGGTELKWLKPIYKNRPLPLLEKSFQGSFKDSSSGR